MPAKLQNPAYPYIYIQREREGEREREIDYIYGSISTIYILIEAKISYVVASC
jgi:hypothetical protein